MSADADTDYYMVEIDAALTTIQLLLPDDAPATHDQQTLQAVAYIVCRLREHVDGLEEAIKELRRTSQSKKAPALPDGECLH